MMNYPWIRFRLDERKSIEGVQLLARLKPGITQYYVSKVFFFADRAHFLDWGRPISGDRYVAMEHGPVPSFVYDLLKKDSGEPDEIEDDLSSRVIRRREENKIHFYERNDSPPLAVLSKSDTEYLSDSLVKFGNMSFTAIKRLSHADPAYYNAWESPGINNEMDLRLWLDGDQLTYLFDNSGVVKNMRVG
jgi:uncharacterized phage-associated protein